MFDDVITHLLKLYNHNFRFELKMGFSIQEEVVEHTEFGWCCNASRVAFYHLAVMSIETKIEYARALRSNPILKFKFQILRF